MVGGEGTIYDRWDQFMYLLSAQPRRQIITSLMDNPEQYRLPLPEAAITPEISVNKNQFEVKLRQVHLPLLAEADYVQWSTNPLQVQRGRRFDEPASAMEVLLSAEDRLASPLVSGCVEKST
jgi:hypothetical protein